MVSYRSSSFLELAARSDFEVSGGRLGGTLLSLELPEENIINGGAFGFEGSVLCTALMIIAIAIILKIQSRKVNQRL